MADINLTCPSCANAITISEFVSAEFITCRKCKAQVPVPARQAATPVTQKLKMPVAPPPEPPSQPAPETKADKKKKKSDAPVSASMSNTVRQYLPKAKKRKQARRVTAFEAKVLPILLFIVLTALLLWLRFWPGALSASDLASFKSVGVWALILLHVSVTCLAFGDEAFYGILCLIIPGYSLYYLFIQAEQMILRAVMGALLITFGMDAAIWLREVWVNVYTEVARWIATTDSVKK